MALAKNSLNVWTSRPQLSSQINVRKSENEQTICLYVISILERSRPQLFRHINVRKWFLKTFISIFYIFLVPKPYFDVIFLEDAEPPAVEAEGDEPAIPEYHSGPGCGGQSTDATGSGQS
jgi:hypothetical protein